MQNEAQAQKPFLRAETFLTGNVGSTTTSRYQSPTIKHQLTYIWRCVLALLAVLISSSVTSWAQVSITSLGTAFTQNFDGMGSSATATLPSGFKIGTDWSSGATATTLAYGTTGAGIVTSSSSGGVINWANGVTGTATDRALGFLNTGTYTSPKSIIYAFQNNTGSTINSLSISFDYEKYRTGSREFDWTFFYGASSSPSTSASGEIKHLLLIQAIQQLIILQPLFRNLSQLPGFQ